VVDKGCLEIFKVNLNPINDTYIHASFSSLVLSLCHGTRRARPCMVVRGC